MKKIYILLAIPVILIGTILFAQKVTANPSFFANYAASSAATTTVSYLKYGVGTSTLSFDAQTGTSQAMDSATLLTQFAGSSTASVLNISFEYSQDGIDWYKNRLSESTTTAPNIDLNVPNSYQWTFASTSALAGAAGTIATSTRIINVSTPTRFVRAVYTLTSTSQNGAVWAQFIGKRQTTN